MRDRHYKIPDSEDVVLPPVLFTKNATSCSCSVPRWLAFGLSTQKLHSTTLKTSCAIPAKEFILKFNQYEPGDKVFSDQFVVHTPGRRLDRYGHKGPNRSLHGGTLYTDTASSLIYVECQTSMHAGERVMGKTGFEQLCSNLASMTVKNFYSDNGVYNASVFCDDCISKDQPQTFSGVGAKHQNSVAERATGPAIWWFMRLFIGRAMVQTIYVSGLLLFNMRCGCSIAFQIGSQVWLHSKFSPRPSLIIERFNVHTFGVALFLCWTLVSKMARRFQSEIVVLALHSLLGSHLTIPHWLPMLDTFKPIMSARSFIWFTTITLKLYSMIPRWIILCPTSASLIFLIHLVKFTQGLNAQKTALLFTCRLLLMISG